MAKALFGQKKSEESLSEKPLLPGWPRGHPWGEGTQTLQAMMLGKTYQ